MNTSPPIHDKFIADADRQAQGKLKKTAKLVKCWRDSRSATRGMLSFYIEMVLAKHALCRGPKSYARCFIEAMDCFAKLRCQPIVDPFGISDAIGAVGRAGKLGDIYLGVRASLQLAIRALEAEERQRTPLARTLWKRVFNGSFHN